MTETCSIRTEAATRQGREDVLTEIIREFRTHVNAVYEDLSLICMANSWLISMVASMSLVCVLLSALIVTWSCQSLRNKKSLPM